MSWQALAWATKQEAGGPTNKLVLLILANYADEAGSCFPKQAQIAEQADCSLRTVKYTLQSLRELGFLSDVKRRRKDGTQCANRYQLSLPNDRVQELHPDEGNRVQNLHQQSAKSAPYIKKNNLPLKPITKEISLNGKGEANPDALERYNRLQSSLKDVIATTARKATVGRRVATHAK